MKTEKRFTQIVLSTPRRLLKIFHPEGIPWPGTVFYNALSTTGIFQRNYELIAGDIVSYCSDGDILDIGTGPGWLLLQLHRRSPNLRITGLDVSPSMVEKARRNIERAGCSGIIEVKEGDASLLPFADDSFHTVVSTGSLHHWKNPVTCLNEVYRVLRNRGYALMYDIVSDTPTQVLNEAARAFGKLRIMLLWLHAFEEPFYSRDGFEQLASSSWFKEGSTRFVGVVYCLILKKDG